MQHSLHRLDIFLHYSAKLRSNIQIITAYAIAAERRGVLIGNNRGRGCEQAHPLTPVEQLRRSIRRIKRNKYASKGHIY